jgi:hypothetical protein
VFPAFTLADAPELRLLHWPVPREELSWNAPAFTRHSGIVVLVMCGFCKKIRDEHGAWRQLESFITNDRALGSVIRSVRSAVGNIMANGWTSEELSHPGGGTHCTTVSPAGNLGMHFVSPQCHLQTASARRKIRSHCRAEEAAQAHRAGVVFSSVSIVS